MDPPTPTIYDTFRPGATAGNQAPGSLRKGPARQIRCTSLGPSGGFGLAFILPHPNIRAKVCKDFTGEVATEIELGASASSALSACRKRQRSFLKMSLDVQKKGRADWRPPKRYRLGSYKNLVTIDSQLCNLGLPGLGHYVKDWDTEPWETWPILTMCLDQESTNLASVHWLMYNQGAAIDPQWDPNHGAWNDVKCAAKASGYMAFLLGLMVVWNLPHGPWADDMRSAQVQEALDLMTDCREASVPPLIEARSRSILQESGCEECLSNPDAIQRMWEGFRQDTPFRKKGSKTSLNRFMSLVKQGRSELKHWSFRLACYELVSMESDMLSSGKVQKLVFKRAEAEATANEGGTTGAEGEAKGTTSSRRPDGVDHALRTSCQNAMVLSIFLLSAPLAWRRLAIFIDISNHIDRWHSRASKTCRSVTECQAWVSQESSGGCLNNIGCIWGSLLLPAAVARQGFWVAHKDRSPADATLATLEDSLAAEAGTMALALIRQRLVRTLPLSMGWPNCASRLLASPAEAEREAARILRAFEGFEQLRAEQGHHDCLRSLVSRSLFKRPCVMLLVKGLRSAHGAVSPLLRGVLQRHLKKCTSTTLIEDSFNSMKNDKVYVRRRRKAQPHRAMAVLLSKEVLSRKHRFKELTRSIPIVARGAKLPPKLFQASRTGHSLPFKDIVSSRPTPAWWSPNAERCQAPIADLALYEHGLQYGFPTLATAWLGTFLRHEHQIMARRAMPVDSPWHFVLGPVGDSAVLLWPAQQVTVGAAGAPSGEVTYWQPVIPLETPCLAVVSCLSSWLAAPFEWRSPAWASCHHGMLDLPVHLLPVQNGAEDSLLRIAARRAFWDLDLAVLQRVSAHIGCEPGKNAADLFEACAVQTKPIVWCDRRFGRTFSILGWGGCRQHSGMISLGMLSRCACQCLSWTR